MAHRKSQLLLACLPAGLALFLGSCGGGTAPTAPVPNEKAPDHFKVRFDTTKGPVLIQVERAWAPLGADRFYTLVRAGFFKGDRFFRVVPKFIVQFGINGDPKVAERWKHANLKDDPVTENNMRGTLSFASAGPMSRTTQLFINLNDNVQLDGSGFAPFGRVIDGMQAIDAIDQEYGEQPKQERIEAEGNGYLEKEFPKLDYIKSAAIVQE